MKQIDKEAHSIATTRVMNRAEFLRVSARLAGACAAGSVFGPVALALGVEPEPDRAPVTRRPIPSTGQMLPVIGVGTAVAYELDTADAKFPVLVETVRTFLANGGAVIDTAPTYGRAAKSSTSSRSTTPWTTGSRRSASCRWPAIAGWPC